jgi:adrenodoxin-NADP+ reductase
LKNHYNQVLLSYGAGRDRSLGLKGENTNGIVIPSLDFVKWYIEKFLHHHIYSAFRYTGFPDYDPPDFKLDEVDTVSIVGHGNVALDIARMLLNPIDTLKKTDIPHHALDGRLILFIIKNSLTSLSNKDYQKVRSSEFISLVGGVHYK